MASQSSYSYDYKAGNEDIIYYRLKLVDLDGTFSYSSIVSVRTRTNSRLFTIYPQPAKGSVTIELTANRQQTARLTITASNGNIVRTSDLQLTAGSQKLTIRNLEGLPSGVYVLRLEMDNRVETQKMMIKHD